MLNMEIRQVNQELSDLLSRYANTLVADLYIEYDINPKSKRCKQSLAKALIQHNGSDKLISFTNRKDVMVKTVKLVRGGQVEASLSLPSFRFDEIVKEKWEESALRTLLAETIFVFIFFDEDSYAKRKDLYIKKGLIWQMPEKILDSSVRKTWETVVDCLKSGKVVKYIGEDGRFHTYFPRTSDGPYVHVRPHADGATPPLPVPDKLTGLTQYPMHSFWITRSYIQKLFYQGDDEA